MFRLVIIALSIGTHSLQPSPTLAQGGKKVRFSCTYSTDGKLTPFTSVGIFGVKGDPRAIIKWSDYKNQTADQRCKESSERFQTAWDHGNFHKLVAKADPRSGEGMICALSYRQTTCDSAHQLFILRNSTEAGETIGQLKETMRGTSSKPIEQAGSLGEIDMQQLIESLSKSTVN